MNFAAVYDRYMDNIPYDKWASNIKKLFDEYKLPSEVVCELGCGTGQMTRRLKKLGYDMIGIDLSNEMLMQAVNNADSHGILYLCQDMRDIELYGTVGAMVSVCDSMNYLEDCDDLLKVFEGVNTYLDENGLFIFDMKTVHFYEKLGCSTIAENRENGSFIWENDYDVNTRDNEYYLTFYEENEDGTFDRFEEEHLQHAFLVEEVEDAIKKSGLELLEILDATTLNTPDSECDRLLFIVREVSK